MDKVFDIVCKGKDGIERIFQVYVSPQSNSMEYTFFVGHDPMPESKEYFQLTLKKNTNNDAFRVRDIHKVDEFYSKQGIPDSLLLKIAIFLNSKIESSTNTEIYKIFRTEKRNQDATKMWQRLLTNNLNNISYCEEKDIYTLDISKN